MKYCVFLSLFTTSLIAAADKEPSPLYSSEQIIEWNTEFNEPIKPYKSSWKAIGLAFLYPGLGHLYLGDILTAISFTTSSSLLTGIDRLYSKDSVSILRSYYDQETAEIDHLKEDKNSFPFLEALENLWSYNVYATYRDVRIYNNQTGYSYGMPRDSLADLTLAPFRWSIIKKPEVWGGLFGALTFATVVSTFAFDDAPQTHISLSTKDQIFPLLAFPVAIGEESFFRGFLQSALYESLSPLGSIITSSLAFGAAHIPNASLLEKDQRKSYFFSSIPMITVFGAYFGYLTYKNQSLQESTAIHAWYDLILFAGTYAAHAKLTSIKPRFALAIKF